jgi:YrbI family 3-deoxy-D-manno-octulosonate 8-phosphate phosphatase
MDIVAVIPATGGPGEVPGGTARAFAGRPLISHSIEHARASSRVSRTVVCTDDEEIARIARDWGAEVVTSLPGMAAADGAPEPVLLHTLDEIRRRDDCSPEFTVLLPPAFPLRTPQMIDAAINQLWDRGGDVLVSVHRSPGTLWVRDKSGAARPESASAKSRVHRFAENGSMRVVRTASLRETASLKERRTLLCEITAAYGLRLVSEDDWHVAEALYRRLWTVRGIERLRDVRLLALDFDGVMTDNRVIVLEDGREAVLCSRGDGMGMDLLRAAGVPAVVISKEGNPVVTARCNKLKLRCVQGVGEKLPVLEGIAHELGIGMDAVAFMGNDVNDLTCIRAAGVGIAPVDSHPSVLREVDIVTSLPGGMGAVREVADLLVAAREAG